MAFEIERFISIRPFLYHLTAAENLVHLRASRLMATPAELMKQTGRIDLLRAKRSQHEQILLGGKEIILRDQKPLREGNTTNRGLHF